MVLLSADGGVDPRGGYGRDGLPYAVAHRGGGGLALENTLGAFARSYELGFRYLETDVQMTADGVCVAFHDATLRRLAGVPTRVCDLTWAQLASVRLSGGRAVGTADAGLGRAPGRTPGLAPGREAGGWRVGHQTAGERRVPRMEELFEAFPDAKFMIDIKDPRGIGPLARALRQSRAQDRVCVAGSADRWLADARAVMGAGVCTAMGWESLTRLTAAARLGVRPRGVVRAPFAHVPLRLHRLPVFVERLVTMVHDLGAQLLVWTVDEPARMHRLLDFGVDGIISDRPDLLREVLLGRGSWPGRAMA